MKLVADGGGWIDYTADAKAGSGIRVWQDRCQLLCAGPDRKLQLSGESYALPISAGVFDKTPPPGWTFLANRSPLVEEVMRQIQADPDTDLLAVLRKEKAFSEAAG